MKKKQMIVAIMLAAVLAGCGQSAQTGQNAGIRTEHSIRLNPTGNEPNAVLAAEVLAKTAMSDNNKVTNGMQTLKAQALEADTQQASAITSENSVSDREASGFGDVATMDNHVNGRELPIYCVETDKPQIAISFDAAWGNEDTAEILSILKAHNIHATFFMTGGWVESYPDDVKAILADGHDLGNHSENHKNMSGLSDEEKEEELMSVHRKVKEITGYDMFLFRPPYGDYDNAVIDVAKDCGYYAIQWDVDSLDWQNKGLDNIIETVTEHKNLGNGSIILCHNGAEYTAQALDELLTSLEAKGYEFLPISQLIYKDNYHMKADGRQVETDSF